MKASFPVLPILGIIFVTLKLTGYIAWSWWWVLAPFWGPVALVVALLLAFGIVWLLFKFLAWFAQGAYSLGRGR